MSTSETHLIFRMNDRFKMQVITQIGQWFDVTRDTVTGLLLILLDHLSEGRTPQRQAGISSSNEPMMTVEQVATWLNVSSKTISSYVADGTIPVYRIGEKSIRFDRNELIEWMRTKPQSSQSGLTVVHSRR